MARCIRVRWAIGLTISGRDTALELWFWPRYWHWGYILESGVLTVHVGPLVFEHVGL